MTIIDQTENPRSRTGLIAHDPAAGAAGLYAVRADVRRRHGVPDRHGRARSRIAGRCPTGPAFTAICSTTAISSTAARSWPISTASRRGRASRPARRSKSTGTAGSCGKSATRTTTMTRASCATATSSCCACGRLPPRSRARVRGGLPGTEADGAIYADYLLEMTTAGEIVWEWRSWEHLDPETHPITPQDHRAEWTHGNTVAETADGNLAGQLPQHLDRRHDRARDRQDRLGARRPPPLAQQHDPRPLPNGNVLIFDNGTHRRDHPATFSRVIEVDPRTSEIVWQYTDQSLFEFFSPYISGAQRLANGNTLICEGVPRPDLRGDARGRGRVGIRQPALLRRAGPARVSTIGSSAPSATPRRRSKRPNAT